MINIFVLVFVSIISREVNSTPTSQIYHQDDGYAETLEKPSDYDSERENIVYGGFKPKLWNPESMDMHEYTGTNTFYNEKSDIPMYWSPFGKRNQATNSYVNSGHLSPWGLYPMKVTQRHYFPVFKKWRELDKRFDQERLRRTAGNYAFDHLARI